MNLLSNSLEKEKPLVLYGDDDIIVNINFLMDVSLPFKTEVDLFVNFPVKRFVSVFASKLFIEVSII